MPLQCRTLHIALTRYFHTSRPLTLLTTTSRRIQEEEKANSISTSTALDPEFTCPQLPEEGSHLNPPPSEYARTIFADRATITIFSGLGGHGCVSFLREKYIEAGPPNGGDGGTGGNVYIQALHGETSLHKLARRNILRAGRGKNGQGKLKGGERGEDVVIQVPVGTVVREVERFDPVAAEESKADLAYGQEDEESAQRRQRREKWLLYPTVTQGDIPTSEFPRLPRDRKSAMSAAQVPAPVSLDLNMPTETPLLLAAGAIGGLGNTHFVSKTCPRPKYATKGEEGIRITLELELKLLADVGLVGLPNAGKSTLLRSLTKSRTRVGNWAFTTLQPNIGTVVLDNYKGRPFAKARFKNGEPRTIFTIADIPGLVTNAHLDRGLGISFLRHVERARVLAFVLDLNAGDAVEALKALWKEVGMYEKLKGEEIIGGSQMDVQWTPFTSPQEALENRQETIVVPSGPDFENPLAPEKISIASKPWFVVATKADYPGTEDNFSRLKDYLEEVSNGLAQHPSLHQRGWREKVAAIPVSAINKLGTDKIVEWTIGLLND